LHAAAEHGALATIGVAASVIVALAGLAVAWYIYHRRPELAATMLARFRAMHAVLLNKYWVDELYDALVVNPTKAWGRLSGRFDDGVIDGLVRLVGRGTTGGAWLSTWIETHVIYGGLNVTGYANHIAARLLRLLQSGLVHHYAAIFLIGLFIIANVLWWTGDRSGHDDLLAWLVGIRGGISGTAP
jgi:NADH-quinone oxidoreductase subunit L